MRKVITAYDIANNDVSCDVELDFPHQCPLCSTGIQAQLLDAYFIRMDNSYKLFVLFFCPKCELCFLGVYFMRPRNLECFTADLKILVPSSKEKTTFSKDIAALSPDFVKIYNQAEEAENCGLDEICGLGYRKALEFLVKDYAIAFNPEDEETIKSQMLASCINKYIDNSKIKTLSTASAWIGNDETHYVRKHADYNLSHLKLFISATVSYIDSELIYLKAESLIKKAKP